jgi:hypothetical protein
MYDDRNIVLIESILLESGEFSSNICSNSKAEYKIMF